MPVPRKTVGWAIPYWEVLKAHLGRLGVLKPFGSVLKTLLIPIGTIKGLLNIPISCI